MNSDISDTAKFLTKKGIKLQGQMYCDILEKYRPKHIKGEVDQDIQRKDLNDETMKAKCHFSGDDCPERLYEVVKFVEPMMSLFTRDSSKGYLYQANVGDSARVFPQVWKYQMCPCQLCSKLAIRYEEILKQQSRPRQKEEREKIKKLEKA